MGKNELTNNTLPKNTSKADALKEELFADDKKQLEDLFKSVFNNQVTSPESLIVDGSLNDQLFDDENELGIFTEWVEKFMFFRVVRKAGYGRERDRKKCIKKNDIKNAPDTFLITIPKDLTKIKVGDIPYIIKQINVASFGEDPKAIPEWTSFKEIAVYLTSLISYLQESGKTDLAKNYEKIYKKYYPDFTIAVDEKLKSNFQTKYDLSNKNFDKTIESDLCFVFKKHLFESVFEGGSKMLYENMKSPKSEKYGTLLKSLEKKGKKLLKARQKGNIEEKIEAEKELIESIYYKVGEYSDSMYNRENYIFPTDVVRSKDMLCFSKTTLVRGLLEKYHIKNEVVEPDRHLYNVVELSDGKKYVVDTNFPDKVFSRESNTYDESFKKTALYESSSNLRSEDILLSEFLHSLSYITDEKQEDIIALELALKMNPNNVRAMFSLGSIYEGLDTPKDQKTAYEKYSQSYDILQKIIQEKKTDNLDYDFKKIQIAISTSIYDINKKNNFEPNLLEAQKGKLIILLKEQIEYYNNNYDLSENSNLAPSLLNYKKNEVEGWKYRLKELEK